MRIPLSALLLFFSLTAASAQKTSEWQRAYTFEESLIELNTSNVVLGGDIGRVTFRWVFDQPEQLSRSSNQRYKTRLETIEFKCADKQYRMFEVTYLDASGKTIQSQMMRPPYQWLKVKWGGVMATLLPAACGLIERKTVALMQPVAIPDIEIQKEQAEKLAAQFARTLAAGKDFKPLIQQFFAANYLDGYLQDDDTNWFLTLSRDVAAQASHAELQRYYVALMNTGYLAPLYLISQSNENDEIACYEKMMPPDVLQLINHHRYTTNYKNKQERYNYLPEDIGSLEQLRSYTDFLEKLAILLRKHVTRVGAERSSAYQEMLEDWDWRRDLYRAKTRTCSSECFNLPKGTRLFQINVPMFQLQLANVQGQMKIVSAIDYFQ
jgi:hypothetical protein